MLSLLFTRNRERHANMHKRCGVNCSDWFKLKVLHHSSSTVDRHIKLYCDKSLPQAEMIFGGDNIQITVEWTYNVFLLMVTYTYAVITRKQTLPSHIKHQINNCEHVLYFRLQTFLNTKKTFLQTHSAAEGCQVSALPSETILSWAPINSLLGFISIIRWNKLQQHQIQYDMYEQHVWESQMWRVLQWRRRRRGGGAGWRSWQRRERLLCPPTAPDASAAPDRWRQTASRVSPPAKKHYHVKNV